MIPELRGELMIINCLCKSEKVIDVQYEAQVTEKLIKRGIINLKLVDEIQNIKDAVGIQPFGSNDVIININLPPLKRTPIC